MQAPYLQQYTDQLISSLCGECDKANGVVDIVKWVNFLTTDLIGDLSFGEPFGGLATGKLHPWLETLFTTLKTFAFMREILQFPSYMIYTAMACIPKDMIAHRREATSFGADAAKRRIARGSDKPDFMSYILKHAGEDGKG